MAALTLTEYGTGADLGLDQLLFRDAVDAHTIHPGRMTPVTALCFAFAGALLLLKTRTRQAGGRNRRLR